MDINMIVVLVGCIAFGIISYFMLTGPAGKRERTWSPTAARVREGFVTLARTTWGDLVADVGQSRTNFSDQLRQIHHDETPIFARLAEELGIDLAGFRPLDGAVA